MTAFEIISGHWTEDFLDKIICGDCKQEFYWSLNANSLGHGDATSDDGWQRGQLPKYCPQCGAKAGAELRAQIGSAEFFLIEKFPGLFAPELTSIVRAIECTEGGPA
jgi:ribosomal protein L33